jgi:hypothetical protein
METKWNPIKAVYQCAYADIAMMGREHYVNAAPTSKTCNPPNATERCEWGPQRKTRQSHLKHSRRKFLVGREHRSFYFKQQKDLVTTPSQFTAQLQCHRF